MAKTRQVDTKANDGRKKKGVAGGSVSVKTDRDKVGFIFGGDDEVQGKDRKGDPLMCC